MAKRRNEWLVKEHEADSYEAAVQGADEPRMVKVSVTVDRGLLSFVDLFVAQHSGLSRSEIFDIALSMWVRSAQEKADMDCYANAGQAEGEKKSPKDWSKIQQESAKDIW